MPTAASGAYAAHKIDSLKECVRLTEDLLSNISDEVKVLELLDTRGEILQALDAFEKDHKQSNTNICTPAESAKVDQLVALLLNLDKQADAQIKQNIQEAVASLKANVNEHKFIGYKGEGQSPQGNFLDTKR